jgi:hypothetical protein
MFSIVAAHALGFLTRTLSMYKVPNVDFTMAFGDFCLGTTRLFHDAWGSVARKDMDTSEAPVAPGAAKSESEDAPQPDGPPNVWITEAFQVPVFQWTNTQSGRKACNVVTTSGYDWNWWGSNFTSGSPWRLDAHKMPPWKGRAGKMVWRGLLISQDAVRSRALRLGLRHPELFDIKALDMDCEKFMVDLQRFNDHNTIADCHAASGNFTPMDRQQQFKYTLDMDGGGSTFRLKNLFLGGFLVFKVDSDTSQFWFDSLEPYVHYVPVARDNFEQDLVRKLRWAIDHDADAEQIAANAHKFAIEHLRDTDAHWQQQAAISMYAAKQNFNPTGADVDMQRFCCKDAGNVNIMKGVKLKGVSSDCVELDPACAAQEMPKEMLYSVPSSLDAAGTTHMASSLAEVPQPLLPLVNITQAWQELTVVMEPFTLVEGHVTRDSAQARDYAALANQVEVQTICETGFNAGHSALLFLLSNPTAHVYSFDLGKYPVTLPAAKHLTEKFSGRFTFIQGDSQHTVADFRRKNPTVRCDLSFVGGGHVAPWVRKDLLNFWHMARGPRSVIIMNDAPCNISWCAAPTEAWQSMTKIGAIRETNSVKIDSVHGYSVGIFAMRPSADTELAVAPVEWTTLAEGPELSLEPGVVSAMQPEDNMTQVDYSNSSQAAHVLSAKNSSFVRN